MLAAAFTTTLGLTPAHAAELRQCAGEGASGTVVVANGTLSWQISTEAPDACHEAGEGVEIDWTGPDATIRLPVVRKPRLCAQVVTSVEFAGSTQAPNEVNRVEIVLVDPRGDESARLVFTPSC